MNADARASEDGGTPVSTGSNTGSSGSSGSSRMDDVLTWMDVNKTKLVGVAGIVVVIWAVAYTVGHLKEKRTFEANAALLALQPIAASESEDKAAGADQYRSVATQFSGTPAGERALFLTAGKLFEEGKHEEARAVFLQFQEDYSASPLQPDAAYGIAACLEAQGNGADAIAAYQKVIDQSPKASVAVQANLAIARLHEANGKPAEALAIYDRLSGENAPIAWSQEVATRRRDLVKAHPELVETNAPPASLNLPGFPSQGLPGIGQPLPGPATVTPTPGSGSDANATSGSAAGQTVPDTTDDSAANGTDNP